MYCLTIDQMNSAANRQARKLFEYCRDNRLHYLIYGSSGGRDSAITAALAQRACRLAAENGYKLTAVAVVMECQSSPKFTQLGILVANTFGAELCSIDLSEAYLHFLEKIIDGNPSRSFETSASGFVRDLLEKQKDQVGLNQLAWSRRVTRGNIMARLRMIVLYHIAGELGSGMVLSTDNLSEYWMGFWTICGDVGDYGMIQNMLKGLELEDFAKFLGVPQEVLDEVPDDGLGLTSRGDAGQLGAGYELIDKIMSALILKGFQINGSLEQLDSLPTIDIEGAKPELVYQLAWRCLKSSFKRRGTLNLTREELGLPPIEAVASKLKG